MTPPDPLAWLVLAAVAALAGGTFRVLKRKPAEELTVTLELFAVPKKDAGLGDGPSEYEKKAGG